ncbi:MAG: DNA polymerase III subunit gamma/tau [Proteobacteria bacterium]|nr:DNA polymerase III subunit gamma/tau [Pseudomonadota bacterium]NDC23264.1 DNA polymerase III subunit gamma/tau [Pseudomonadota bacterium]NDD03691.1 DNA polymerase III subunit gamma/tau [Pseudomonadota bacterium]NDG26154.1 DNA polymerase III subunit gamma/tau [Pseudomonadota bacterium]
MAYLAIARKWRPSRFEDLVGQGHVVQTLKNAIQFNRVSHAYLFSGSRGIGKTSVARIFAKALRCPNAINAVPCNECPECLAISESRSVDVVEIDGASNNGVEAVRGIRDNVAYGASSGKHKIYIIDEVHMLSISAFNALLKTLEEPPPHVVFIFATTEVQKIPLTILGRCQRFEFRRLTQLQVVERLQKILEVEKVALDEEGLRLIASYSDGSLRDALSLLDQVLSFYSGEKNQSISLNEKQVVEALGVTDTNAAWLLVSQLAKQDMRAALQNVGEIYRSGADLKGFSERVLEQLRLLYLTVVACEAKQAITSEELDISSGHFNRLKEAAQHTHSLQVERMAQILGKTIQQLAWSSLPQFNLEMAVVRICKLEDLYQIEEVLRGKSELNSQAPRTVPVSAPTPTEEGPTAQYERSWKGFVDFVMKKRPLLGALLTHANFKLEGESHYVLAFPEGSFYEKQSTEPKNFKDIGDALKAFFGKETTFVLSNAIHLAEQSLAQQQDVKIQDLKKSALENSAVIGMKKVLGAEVVDVQVKLNS